MKNMKTFSKVPLLCCLILFSKLARAHCPSHSKSEQVCFMLDENKVYVWDDKLEHNGPYRDTKDVLKFSDNKGRSLASKKIARGIYQIESDSTLKNVFVEGSEKNFPKIKIKSEH